MINSVCGIKSTGRICTDIARQVDLEGHTVKIGYGRDEDIPEEYRKYAIRIGNDLDVLFHGVRARIFDESGYGSRKVTEKFINWVRIYDPDIIHLHNIHGYYINIEVLFNYLKICRKPVIWTLHDCWPLTGHCAYFNFVHCDKWSSRQGCRQCPGLKEYPVSFGIDHSSSNYRLKRKLFKAVPDLTLVTPSEWLAGIVRKSFLKNKPVRVIHNGIDTGNFKPTDIDLNIYGITDKKIILGVSSAWDGRKGLWDFVKLDQILHKQSWGNQYQIVLVGVTEEQKIKLPKDIICIPKTADIKELAGLYTRAFVLYNPTYGDNYPTVNLEARACGTRVITYLGTGGSMESAGEDGVGIHPGDITGVAEAIRKIDETGSADAKVSAESLSYKLMVRKYIELYQEVQM